MRAYLMGSAMAVAMVLAAGTVFAAESNRQEVTIPFAFVVNGQTLPAGTYNIERPRDMESSGILIRGEAANHASAYALVIPAATSQSEASVVFAKRGDQVRLTQVGSWALAE